MPSQHCQMVTQATILNTLKNCTKLLAVENVSENNQHNVESHRVVKYPRLDDALSTWFRATEESINIFGDLVKIKAAKFFAELYPGETSPQFSNG
ncbi:hypothetical protein GcC1_097018 [Golovinomyces cichoracearum]|uniref:Uncharacterized protein n=1 Tax=Golovinomyces cichoracearum TaxID=62708 RepID=A0A420IAI3_9PEZI|nr:hypothetical protein GcC1_097018 [Golovinomyces cichoracearum]